MKKYTAEFLGTFMLVLVGTGSIILNDNGIQLGVGGIAIAFGGIVTLMILIFGPSSGAHINPAVSISFYYNKSLTASNTLYYVLAQFAGAVLASVSLQFFYPNHELLGTTLPASSWQSAFLLEFLLTFLLMFVILFFSQQAQLKKYTAWAVGLTVGLEAYFAGPFTGASMNPARSLGPAVVSGHTEYLWVYLLSTILGALLATFLWLQLRNQFRN